VDDLDGDGAPDEIVFLAALKPGEKKSYSIVALERVTTQPSRAHAGMFLAVNGRGGMEGPGWETDLIAFRMYWDKRNAIDVFGKTQPILSLDQFASPKVNYHRLSKWGQDVLKVKTSLGIGGFGVFEKGKIEKVAVARRSYKVVADGPIRAAIDFKYDDWKTSASDRTYRLTARMNVFAGQRWAEAQLTLDAAADQPLPELVTGVVKHEDTELVADEKAAFIGRWGRQALGNNEVPKDADLGLGVVVDPALLAGTGEDKVSSYMRLKTEPGKTVVYRYHASWQKEPGAARSAAEYKTMLEKLARMKPVITLEK
jgi:hypothetical protein